MPSKGKGRKKKKSGSTSMDFSAAENFLSSMDFGIDLDFNPGYSGGYFDETLNTLQQTVNMVRLNKIFQQRKNKLPLVNPTINAINNVTERAVKNLITKKNEFYYSNRKIVKAGTSYHTHYTSQLTQHFMTGAEHSSLSKLIYPTKRDVSQFTYYNSLNKQSPLKLNSRVTIPTEDDYNNGTYTRYFAKQANDKNEPSFEIRKSNFASSPLYNYTTVNWFISGNKNSVYARNIREINRASRSIPNIKKILSPFQFYRYEEDLSSAEDRRNALLAMLELMKSNFADFLANYNTTTQTGSGTGGDGTNTGAGSAGTCSLGSQFTTKEACEAAGGSWTDANPSGFDKDGNEVEPPKMC